MKKIRFQSLLVISSTFALTLLATGRQFDAGFGQLLQNVQTSPAPISPEHQEAAELFIELTDRHNFFAARYKACHIERSEILCKTFYKGKDESGRSKNDDQKSAQLLKLIRQKKWAALTNTSHSEAAKAVLAMRPKERELLTRQIVALNTCVSSHLITALAFKLEEQLPSSKALKSVRSLYAKSLDCATDTEVSELGLYRGGLIEVWQGDTQTAEKFLTKLSAVSTDISLTSRAQFWLNQNDRSQGGKVSEVEMENHFLNFPLSYHILTDYASMQDGPFQKISDQKEQKIQTRSHLENLNSAVQLTEYFLTKNREPLAKRALEFFDYSKLTEAEPGFQLYVATLLAKFDELNHQRFLVLSRLFQKYPEYKTLTNMGYYYPLAFEDLVLKHHRNQDPYLLLSLIRQESSFNPNTKSPVGATGLMQIMPRTAKDLRKRAVTDKELFDPSFNIQMGARYFAALVREFKNDHMKALASYNAGSGNVRKWMKRYPTENQLLFVDLIPFEETREYVAGILRNQYWYSKLYPELTLQEPIASQASTRK